MEGKAIFQDIGRNTVAHEKREVRMSDTTQKVTDAAHDVKNDAKDAAHDAKNDAKDAAQKAKTDSAKK